uniref:Guided entry of tail-anchored proteins factor 4 n=1 Tax=Myotis myotis TaxID=51298 RepID=A0A7J7XG08_MYOMY|nr:guided entry of tail-anchored proteins factor 4 [Myotis myotis]
MSQSKHAEARELMCSGALLFFSHGQQNSAADLSMLVLESLEKAEVEVADELLENLAKLFSLMDPNSPERVAFVSRALKWSSGGSGRLGHPRLHQLLALTLDRIGQLFFGVPPKQTSSYGGLLGNLLSSLMGSSEQEGEDSQDDSSPIELD